MFSVSPFDAEHKRGGLEGKPTSLLVSLGEALN